MLTRPEGKAVVLGDLKLAERWEEYNGKVLLARVRLEAEV